MAVETEGEAAMDVGVIEAAQVLGMDPSRVRFMLRSGQLQGRRSGSIWLIDTDVLAALAGRPRLPIRPLAPRRAWALLDLLDGGQAQWLAAPARSQVRAVGRQLSGQDASRWQAALAARAEVRPSAGHVAVPQRLACEPGVVEAGPAQASARGLNLVAVGAPPEFYVDPDHWPKLAARFHVGDTAERPDLVIRLPRGGIPFGELPLAGQAAVAADCLDVPEPRAIAAAAAMLNELAAERLMKQS
jgi:hypothetical protein